MVGTGEAGRVPLGRPGQSTITLATETEVQRLTGLNSWVSLQDGTTIVVDELECAPPASLMVSSSFMADQRKGNHWANCASSPPPGSCIWERYDLDIDGDETGRDEELLPPRHSLNSYACI